jgi:hypothetical protein
MQGSSWLNDATPGRGSPLGVAHSSFFRTFPWIFAVTAKKYEQLIPYRDLEENFTLFRLCTRFSENRRQ